MASLTLSGAARVRAVPRLWQYRWPRGAPGGNRAGTSGASACGESPALHSCAVSSRLFCWALLLRSVAAEVRPPVAEVDQRAVGDPPASLSLLLAMSGGA